MIRCTRTMLVTAAMLLAANGAWAHNTELSAAALNFERAARQMQHLSHAQYGDWRVSAALQRLTKVAHRYRHATEPGRPAHRARRQFFRLARVFHELCHDYRQLRRRAPGARLQRAFRRLNRAFHRLEHAQPDRLRHVDLSPTPRRAWNAAHGA